MCGNLMENQNVIYEWKVSLDKTGYFPTKNHKQGKNVPSHSDHSYLTSYYSI